MPRTTWIGTTTDWNDPANWLPNSPPTGPTGTAFFGASGITAVDFSVAGTTTVGSAQFSSGAQQYTFNLCSCQALQFNGAGIVNQSAVTQLFFSDGTISFLNSSTAGNAAFTMFGSGLTEFRQTSSAALSFVAVQEQSVHTPAYSEQAAGSVTPIALDYRSQTTSRLRSEIGILVDRQVGRVWGGSLALFGRVAWAHEYWRGDQIVAGFQVLPGAPFTVQGAAPTSNAALLSAGADLALANGMTLRGKVEGEFSDTVRSYSASATLRTRW